MKVVRNTCFGGFGLSDQAIELLRKKTGDNTIQSWDYENDDMRTDPFLIEVVEELDDAANDECAELEVVEIPDDVDWYISDYDGFETIEEVHRSW